MKIRNISGFKRSRHHWFIGFLCLAAVVAGLVWYGVALDQVTVKVDGQTYAWKTLSPTVARALREKGITVRPGDQVNPVLGAKISEGLAVEVERAFTVRIQTADQVKEFSTTAQTVETVLRMAKVDFDADDRVIPALGQQVQPDQEIRVIRVSSEIVKQQTAIKPGTEYQRDTQLERGVRQVLRQGREGIVESQVKRVYEDGKITQQYKISEKIIKPMTNTIIALGVKAVARTLVTSRGSYRYIEARTMSATAYSPGPESCGKYATAGRTYTGKKAGFGIVAVDPRVIRLGTMLYIEGYGKAEAADIGGAIKGNKIDLCFETYREAVLFGRKKVKVYILER
ncbi:MAG TPA: ubiquitin-like domain-containing protein [Bacillota bacterium]|nr:ubiquitin-like domain-containing protein [Bacillota bacterium]